MGSGGSSTMLAYEGSLDRRPSMNHACPTSKRAGLFELLHAASRCRGHSKTSLRDYNDACGLPLFVGLGGTDDVRELAKPLVV